MKRFLVMALFCLPLAIAHAQTTARMLIGMSGYTMVGEPELDVEPVFRLAGGGGIQYELTPNLGLRGELRYTIQGGRFSGTIPGNDRQPIPVDATFDLTYLEVPFMVVGGLDILRATRIEVGAGPAIAIKVDTRNTFSAETGPEIGQGVDAPPNYKGWTAMFDVMFPVRGERVLLGLRLWRATSSAGLEETVPGSEDLRTAGVTLVSGVSF
ncbi:MAG: outer membrane beta-barrel protein [Rhodothermales bacterium]|nr:outer membrane beta-barrel protein [Rhodothermales bacterium]MBO6779589.1 outer membrane beta-barrel protein [Rhodothermales bacterium]